jgi:hypothetical protein
VEALIDEKVEMGWMWVERTAELDGRRDSHEGPERVRE